MSSLKPFDLEAAKAGAKVVTRGGRPVRIICYDRKNKEYPIIALVGEDEEVVLFYSSGGRYLGPNLTDHNLDLFIAPVKREGWVNLYRNPSNGCIFTSLVHKTKAIALDAKSVRADDYIATAKVEWEE